MTPQEFCYWLQGHFEISGSDDFSGEQVAMIKRHLELVFENVTNTPVPAVNERVIQERVVIHERPAPYRPDRRLPYC